MRSATFLKKRVGHRCFPVNFGKFLRTSFLLNISGRLLLYIILIYSFAGYMLNAKYFLHFVLLISHCVKSVQRRSFSWSAVYYIQTEYGDLLRDHPYSVWIRKILTRKNSVFGHFSHSEWVLETIVFSNLPCVLRCFYIAS